MAEDDLYWFIVTLTGRICSQSKVFCRSALLCRFNIPSRRPSSEAPARTATVQCAVERIGRCVLVARWLSAEWSEVTTRARCAYYTSRLNRSLWPPQQEQRPQTQRNGASVVSSSQQHQPLSSADHSTARCRACAALVQFLPGTGIVQYLFCTHTLAHARTHARTHTQGRLQDFG